MDISNETGAAEAMRPEGVTPDEWELIRRHREQKAAEEARAKMWAEVLAELAEVSGEGEGRRGDWRAAGLKFIERAEAVGWNDDEVPDAPETDAFIDGLLKAAGWRETTIRNYGQVWARGKL